MHCTTITYSAHYNPQIISPLHRLHYTTLHPLHYTTLHYTTLHYTTSTTLHFNTSTIHYIHYIHYTILNYSAHYLPLAITPLHPRHSGASYEHPFSLVKYWISGRVSRLLDNKVGFKWLDSSV